MMRSTGHQDGIVTVSLVSHVSRTPLGMLLAPAVSTAASNPSSCRVTIVAGWEKVRNKMGPIQRSGQVRLGDRLVRINNVDVTSMTFRQIMELLRGMIYGDSIRLKSMGFSPLASFVATPNRSLEATSNVTTDHQRFYTFSSSIRRARSRTVESDGTAQEQGEEDTSHDSHAEGSSLCSLSDGTDSFVEYEIVCHLVTRFTGGLFRIGEGGEELTWSVWKRYSEFKELDAKFRSSYGWQISALNNGRGVSFPPQHALSLFFGGIFNPALVERRRAELESYWKSIQTIDEIVEFTNPSSHRYSRDMASFLGIEDHLRRVQSTAGDAEDGDGLEVPEATNANVQSSLGPYHMERQNRSFSTLSSPSEGDGGEREHDVASFTVGDNVDGAIGQLVIGDMSSSKQSAESKKEKRKKRRAAKPAFQRRMLQVPGTPNTP